MNTHSFRLATVILLALGGPGHGVTARGAALEIRETSRIRNPDASYTSFGYIVGGVGFYGFVGYWLDRWWGTSFAVVVGILVGAVLGTYLTVVRFGLTGPDDAPASTTPDNGPNDSPARREQD